MSNYIEHVTDSLKKIISDLSEDPRRFLIHPDSDFSRIRKIDFKTFVGITMNSGGCTMSKELLDYFDFDVNTPTVSAYTQQRANVLPDAFEYLFKTFTDRNVYVGRKYHGYRIIACDGSNLSIAPNPNDTETAWKSDKFDLKTNHLHLNAFYDVLNRIYLDVIIQTASEYGEERACVDLLKRSNLDNAILVADRNYENYNIIAHAINEGYSFS